MLSNLNFCICCSTQKTGSNRYLNFVLRIEAKVLLRMYICCQFCWHKGKTSRYVLMYTHICAHGWSLAQARDSVVVPTQCLSRGYHCVLLEMPLALPYNRIKNGVCTTGFGWHIDSNGLIDRKHLKLGLIERRLPWSA